MKKTGNVNGNSKGTVKAKLPAADGLKEVFIDELKNIVYAERALLKSLPKMAKNASEPKLVTAIEEHIAVTQNQVERLENIFEILGESSRGVQCDAVEDVMKESESMMEKTKEGPGRDAGIISASPKTKHDETASHKTLAALAKPWMKMKLPLFWKLLGLKKKKLMPY